MNSPPILLEWRPGAHDHPPTLRHEEASPYRAHLTVLGSDAIGFSSSVHLRLPPAPNRGDAKALAARVYAACCEAMERILEEGA